MVNGDIQQWLVNYYHLNSDSNEIGKLICRMEFGTWDASKMAGYNMVDAVSRSTVQVR